MRVDGKGWILSDEDYGDGSEESIELNSNNEDDNENKRAMITVPTCHIFSEKDPLCWMSYSLSNTCQEDGKMHILHEEGHTIPHSEALMNEVAEFARRVDRGEQPDLSAYTIHI